MKRTIIFLVLLCNLLGASSPTFAQADATTKELPPVFILGQYQAQYDELRSEYPKSLLQVCNYDMEEAYAIWIDMLKKMEKYAEIVNVDLTSLKLHLNVYWNADGTIDYLAFYPKGKSKSMATNELLAFFLSFTRNYTAPKTFKVNFSHNASAIFPLSLQGIKE